MKNLTTDTPTHDPQADQDLYDLLTKQAEQTGDDEDETTVGTTPQPDDEDLERESGNIDAPWGEKPSPEVVNFANQGLTKFKETRERFIEKHFDSQGVAAKAQQAVVGQQLDHASSGDYETSSPLLSEQAKKAIG
jgi:hypothetical protein